LILQVYNSLQELSHSAEKMFMSMVNGSNLSVVVPGGSTPMYLFELLARKSVDWKNVTLILSDERMVPINHKASNYGMIKKIFLERLNDDQHPKVLPEMEKFRPSYLESFLQETNILMKEITTISHAFLGIGSDGHTASIFDEREASTDGNNSPYFFTKNKAEPFRRMSLSIAFLQQIPKLTFLVSGETKQKALKSIINSKNPKSQSSAFLLINNFNGRLKILCDEEARPNISNV